MKIYLHVPTMTLGIVTGKFVEFVFNNKKEESFFPTIKHEWEYVGEL